MKILDGQGYEIDLEVLNRTLTGEARIPDKLSYAATVSGYRLVLNSENEFRTFQDSRFQATQNETFYAVLEQFYRTGGDSGKRTIWKAVWKTYWEASKVSLPPSWSLILLGPPSITTERKAPDTRARTSEAPAIGDRRMEPQNKRKTP